MSADVKTSDQDSVSLGSVIAARIDAHGPVSLHDYMALANTHYYAAADPLGAAGDFITAPEISQMFGELIGLWLADLQVRAGCASAHYVELGPGRGTLAVDALRAMTSAGCPPASIHLVETSPVLRAAQSKRLPAAIHHDNIDSLPTDGPLLIVANEFFDALPIRQYLRTDAGWREIMLGNDRVEHGVRFLPRPGEADVSADVHPEMLDAPQGSLIEQGPAAAAIMADLAARIVAQGGVMITIDYGHEGPAIGDSLQAVAAHRYADPFAAPGTRDLTAHVDFTILADAARAAGAALSPIAEQGAFLNALGIGSRAGALARANPAAADSLIAAMIRLTEPDEMGTLFKVLAVRHPDWPQPEAFDAPEAMA